MYNDSGSFARAMALPALLRNLLRFQKTEAAVILPVSREIERTTQDQERVTPVGEEDVEEVKRYDPEEDLTWQQSKR